MVIFDQVSMMPTLGINANFFSKPSIMIFLHGLQDHIKVIILMLANHAGTLSNSFNKNAK